MTQLKHSSSCGIRTISLLENYGVEVIFGIPGVHTTELYRGIANSKIRHITPRHEQSAAFMADGYARATGKVGVCCIITGPGITNASTGLAQSYSDSVPVLALSSVNKVSSLGMGQGDLHELHDQKNLTEHFTAFSHTVLDVNTVPEVFARAFTVFNTMRPLPVHIEIPIDLIDREVQWPNDQVISIEPPTAASHLIEKTRKLLLQAKSCAVILGGGSKHAGTEATELVNFLNAPAVTTFAAKGVISSSHELSLGANLLHPPVLDFLKQAEVVLAVGTHLSETDIWCRDGEIEFDGKLIRIDIDPTQINRNAQADLGLIGDSRLILRELLNQLSGSEYPQRPNRKDQEKLVRTLLEDSRSYWYDDTADCNAVWKIIRSALPDDGIVTADSTKLVYSGNFCYPSFAPRTYLTSTTGYGTLGYALPAAIGAQFGKPDTPVVCVAGDGGFMFTIQELATAVEHKLPIVIILWNNEGYGIIRDHFEQFDVPQVGVDIQSPDFLTVAKGFGCCAEPIESLDDLKPQIERALQRHRPTVLEIRPDHIFRSGT